MKRINAPAVLIALFLGLAVVTSGHAQDYYIYQTPNGALVISNKEPPPGSKIIKQRSFPEATESKATQGQQPNNPPPNGQIEGSSKLSKDKQP